MEDALHPFFTGHQPRFFGRQVDSRFPAQAEPRRIVRDVVNPKLRTDGVEKNVTGLINGSVNLDVAVGWLVRPENRALELASVERALSRAEQVEVFVDEYA